MNIRNLISKVLFYEDDIKEYDFNLPDVPQDNIIESEEGAPAEKQEYISSSLEDNLNYLKVQYNYLINSDVVIRDFKLIANNKSYNAFIFYIDGMVNSDNINDFILYPLMLRNKANSHEISKSKKDEKIVSSILAGVDNSGFNLESYIYESLLPQNSVKKSKEFDFLISDINSGNCVLFVDNLNSFFAKI